MLKKRLRLLTLFSFLLAVLDGCGCAHQPETPKPHPDTKESDVEISAHYAPKHTNALARETSPYLLQHAHNPVNWHPWGKDAFDAARQQDKPIFLSVGYSSCHWCHVMERESFENEDVARVLNDSFISIKVDREERPDVDEIYMTAVQLLTQSGGWPMSVFMTADGKPFFGGTYFAPEERYGRPGFKSLLERVAAMWKERRGEVLGNAEQISAAMRKELAAREVPAEGPLDDTLLTNAVRQLHDSFDTHHGGFNARPKFPPHNALPLLLHLQTRTPQPDPRIRGMLKLTLDQMALGGIHDLIGGGFHRYSTDERWLVPHFEKMLYDNALLAQSYAQASAVLDDADYARVARAAYDWVLREMTSPEGGFFSALDADSEGQEGKYYLWTKAEIGAALGDDARMFCTVFDVRTEGNFHEEATGGELGLNIPHIAMALAEHASRLNVTERDLRAKVDGWRTKLLAVRHKRVPPGLDDKILTSWNALMIASLARGSVMLKEARYKAAAERAAEFLLKRLRTPDGRWLATYRKGQSKQPAYLDDHAFLAVAFLGLHTATGDARWKTEAINVVDAMEAHFADERGGYFFTADDHEKLLARMKDPTDKATPSGNGMAAQALVKLARLTGDDRYRAKARALFREFHGLMEQAPRAMESMLLALAWHLDDTGDGANETGGVQAAPWIKRGPVTAELLVGAGALRRGASVGVAVRFSVDPRWHLQAPSAAPGPAATTFSLVHTPLGQLGPANFPAAQALKTPELDDELKGYWGTVVAGALLTVRPDAPFGEQTLEVNVHFQACGEHECLAPQDVRLSVPVRVVESAAAIEEQHREVFESLSLGR